MMKLYSNSTDPFSHRCRIVLFEKGMDFEVIDVDLTNQSEDLSILSPYSNAPVLVERDLVLTDANIINEYIDERFPHPQLMPPDPVMRARARLFLKDFENELFVHMHDMDSTDQSKKIAARKIITETLIKLTPILTKQPFLLHDEYSMLDVAIAPLLWRLDHYEIKLPNQSSSILKYADKLFKRPLFEEAMSPTEKAMR
ncbi:glutathione S-transferase N-terminal domain-containing protein [Methylophilaceae bacterium]|jgi:RNA polymerase-associated protein|nr:stringent starvation protein A [Nitrosomonadales bacterium]MBT6355600.1 stringent starvation protein A [Nitrosomonadales bacterium]MCH9771683.1 glutathione S-transferase N-terminal domain-containing protein [Betaproteobacteria bacterium]MDA9086322.1 glutathione S-transferase N-terminal domain-containing protein [Methylophilaceae bacterium]